MGAKIPNAFPLGERQVSVGSDSQQASGIMARCWDSKK